MSRTKRVNAIRRGDGVARVRFGDHLLSVLAALLSRAVRSDYRENSAARGNPRDESHGLVRYVRKIPLDFTSRIDRARVLLSAHDTARIYEVQFIERASGRVRNIVTVPAGHLRVNKF